MPTLRVGMIGLGVISRFYTEAFPAVKGLELSAVCDLDEAKVRPFRARGVATFTDYRSLIHNPDLDAVVINLPNDLHFAACSEALGAGKHVCCEKPLTLRTEEAEALVRASWETGRTLFTAFHRRYNVNFVRLIERVVPPGRVARVEAYYLERIEDHAGDDLWNMDPARCGGGCIADNGPNVFDLLSQMLGPLEVTGVEVVSWAGQTDMEARVALVNGHGVTAEVHLDWAYPHGERKGLVVDLVDGRRFDIDLLAGYVGFKSSLSHEYVAILSDFARRIGLGGCHGEEGADVVWLVEDAYRLVQPGKEESP